MLDLHRPRALAVTLVLALVASLARPAPAIADPTPAEARVAAAATVFAATLPRLAAGAATPELVYTWSVRWLDAQRDQPLRGKALVAAAQAHLDRMTALESKVGELVKAGALPALDAAAATYYRVEAALWLARKGKR